MKSHVSYFIAKMERQSFKKLFPQVSGVHDAFQNLCHCILLQASLPTPPLSHTWLSALSSNSMVLWETDLTSGLSGWWWPANLASPSPAVVRPPTLSTRSSCYQAAVVCSQLFRLLSYRHKTPNTCLLLLETHKPHRPLFS